MPRRGQYHLRMEALLDEAEQHYMAAAATYTEALRDEDVNLNPHAAGELVQQLYAEAEAAGEKCMALLEDADVAWCPEPENAIDLEARMTHCGPPESVQTRERQHSSLRPIWTRNPGPAFADAEGGRQRRKISGS
jgi:hypothetical protein